MGNDNLQSAYHRIGRITCQLVFGLGLFYALITIIGLLSLKSPSDMISDPYFTMMEILSILIAVLMAISVVAVHYSVAADNKLYSLTAVACMFITTGITSCVHFVVLSIRLSPGNTEVVDHSLFFSFKWPSVVYALDILAWDLFFGISMLFLAPVFRGGRIERFLRVLLIISGVLSLLGLLGLPLQNMQVRNIGIIGYAGLAPIAFLLMGKILGKKG
jgi:hypothetical protein